MRTIRSRALGLAAATLALSPAASPAQSPLPAAAAQAAPSTLWATINSCDPPERPASVGVRVSMPDRGGAAQWVRVRLQFFDAETRAWRVVRRGGDTGFRRLSAGGSRVLGGTTFMFTAPRAGSRLKLRGLVNVQWRRAGRVVSRARMRTSAGHENPDDPLLRVSRATCDIER